MAVAQTVPGGPVAPRAAPCSEAARGRLRDDGPGGAAVARYFFAVVVKASFIRRSISAGLRSSLWVAIPHWWPNGSITVP